MTDETTTVYVIGATRDRHRVKWAYQAVHNDSRLVLAHDWFQHSSTIQDHRLTPDEQRRYADEDLKYVRAADVVWILFPRNPTKGGWVELGVAHENDKLIVGSGNWRQSIFCSLAHEVYDTDGDAFAAIIAHAERRAQWE